MGQAKKRGTYEERVRQAKKAGRTPGRNWITDEMGMELTMAQFHYKSNTDDGVMFTLDPSMPDEARVVLLKQIQKCVKQLRDEIDRDDYSQFPGVNNRQQAIDWYMGQLKENIPIFNQAVYGQPTHPEGIVQGHYDFSNEKFIKSVIVVAGNIWLLTDLGQIPNNEYNGTAFTYAPIKKVA